MKIPRVTLVGHPYVPIGTGRALRVTFESLRSVGIETRVRDVWGYYAPDSAQTLSIVPAQTDSFGPINIFHLNGDEIERALDAIGPLPEGQNIVYPMWELPRYPAVWSSQLTRFDEVWGASAFICRSLSGALSRPVIHMPLATSVVLDSFVDRRFFGIPEGTYAFMFSFDCRSFIARKNPEAVVECFRRLRNARPWAPSCLVVKLHGRDAAPDEAEAFVRSLADLGNAVVLLEGTMEENVVHNLVRCCDAFVSLHRAEGYGFGLAEAMYLGLPVIGTGYSGNMDFMTSENSFPISYQLIAVPPGAYPHAEDQTWAEPDLDEAAACMVALVDNPTSGRELGRRASRDLRVRLSHRAAGLRYRERLDVSSWSGHCDCSDSGNSGRP